MEAKGSSILEEYMRSLHQEMQDPDSMYERINILTLSEEQKERVFETWGKEREQKGGAGGGDDIKLDGEIRDKTLWKAYEGFLKGGEAYSQLQYQGESNPKKLWK